LTVQLAAVHQIGVEK